MAVVIKTLFGKEFEQDMLSNEKYMEVLESDKLKETSIVNFGNMVSDNTKSENLEIFESLFQRFKESPEINIKQYCGLDEKDLDGATLNMLFYMGGVIELNFLDLYKKVLKEIPGAKKYLRPVDLNKSAPKGLRAEMAIAYLFGRYAVGVLGFYADTTLDHKRKVDYCIFDLGSEKPEVKYIQAKVDIKPGSVPAKKHPRMGGYLFHAFLDPRSESRYCDQSEYGYDAISDLLVGTGIALDKEDVGFFFPDVKKEIDHAWAWATCD